MTSLSMSTLKSKLHKLKKEDTNEVTDYRTWMKKITDCGNRPEDWLDYTNYMRQNIQFNDRIQAHNFLSDLYEKAFRAIDAKENKQNEAFAHLFIDFAEVQSTLLPEEAIHLLTEARNIVRKFAIVHVASAEMEIKEGNISKAKKILEKAKLFKAEPGELLTEALKKLEAGETLLMSPRHRKYSSSTKNIVQPSPTDAIVPAQIVNTTSNLSATFPRQKCGPDEMETAPIMLDSDKEHFLSARSNSCKPAMRSYSSTPEIRSIEKSQWKRKDIGLPKRVKKLNLPFTPETAEDEEEDIEEMDTMGGFKPLDPQASSTFAFVSLAQTSGYQSMMDTTIPMETEKQTDKQTCDISNIVSSKDKQPPKTDTMSFLKPDKPKIMVDPMSVNPTSSINMALKETSVNPTPSKSLAVKETSVNPTPNKTTAVKDLSINPTPYKQIVANKSVDPTPSKQVLSNLSSHVQICATPSVSNQSNQMPVPFTPSGVMKDVETITVNGVVYMIIEMIGQGGSSKVYQVYDSKPPTKAMKVVNLNDANEEIINGYKNEVNLLLQLQYCPKVIKIYDYEYRPEEQKLFIVMEYGNHDFGKLLKDTIKEDGKLSNHLIKYYWESMLMAVHALHKEGIIHSDLKPSNFIIIGGKLKLIDFGIAKSVQPDKTSVLTDTTVGTLNYMSPESIMDLCEGTDKPVYKIGVKSDVWSLGCILYNMVYGYTPFQKIVKQFAKLQAIINHSYIIQFPDVEDKLLMDVMKKCLTRDPKIRPGIEELLQHPYLKNEKKEEQSVADIQIERLVKKLSEKFASSPNTVRSLVRSEIKKGTKDKDFPEKENINFNM